MGYGMNDLIKGMSGNIDKIAEAANKKKAQEEAEELKKLREPPKKITLGDTPAKVADKKLATGFNGSVKKKAEYGQESLDKIQKALAEIEEAQNAKRTYKSPAR